MEKEFLSSVDFIFFARLTGSVPHIWFASVRFFPAIYAEAFVVVPLTGGDNSVNCD